VFCNFAAGCCKIGRTSVLLIVDNCATGGCVIGRMAKLKQKFAKEAVVGH
jgi:hypothetical protein